jgi:hypothetical protein
MLRAVLSGEATNTNFIVFGLTRPGLEPIIYHTRGEHANYYTNDAVYIISTVCILTLIIVPPFHHQLKPM